jgi:hypothetical protein
MLTVADRYRWLYKPLVFLACSAPLLIVLGTAFGLLDANSLGADPVRETIHRLGKSALNLLLITLAVTPLRQLAHVAEVAGGQAAGRPLGRGEGGLVEVAARVDARHHLVVIAAHREQPGTETAHGVHHLVGGSPITDQVAQHEHRFVALAPGPPQDGFKRVPVGVHVREDQITHYRFPISRAILAAISSGPSSGATSIVTSARR